jgi:CheY-like chemotaxis protein
MLQKPLSAEATAPQSHRARSMEVVGQLTGGIAHDFNNILTVIAATIEIPAEAVADRPDLAAIASLIDQAATRGADLTAHLLAFARGQPSQPCEVDVNALLRDAARLLRPTLGAQIEIETEPALAADLPLALVDPHQLMTAILRLAIDARDAMPRGGRLSFRSGRTAVEECDAGAGSGAATENDVVIAIGACGYGSAAGDPEPAFVDLGTVEQCSALFGRHTEICHEAGYGTTVRVYLPWARGSAELSAENPRHASIEGGNEAILIVEDDVLLRSHVVTQVQDLGYLTFAASNAIEALTIIDSGERIDLLFTDLVMPGSIDGRQLAIDALHRWPSLRVLYTSGDGENDTVHQGSLDAGAPLLAKPYRKVELAKMIRIALAGLTR